MWIIPTRNNPDQCGKVLDRIKEAGCTTKGVVFVNGEGQWEGYNDIREKLPEGWALHLNKKDIGVIGALNQVMRDNPNAEFYGFISDRVFMQTGGWDGALIDAAGAWGFSYGMEDMWGEKESMKDFFCVGGDLARAVGYMGPPEAFEYGVDIMWNTLSSMGEAKSVFVRNVLAKILPLAELTAEEQSQKNIDDQVYMRWIRSEASHVCERIKNNRIFPVFKLKVGL
jgi:hypothetical protein